MSDLSSDAVALDAKAERAFLAADIRELRRRTRPARIASDLKESASNAVSPVVNNISGAIGRHPLLTALMSAVLGAAAFQPETNGADRHASRHSKSNRASATPRLSLGATASLIGLGLIAGAVAGRRIAVGPEERRILEAMAADLHDMFVRTSMQHVNDVLASDTTPANALKIALAAIAVLTQHKAK